jgi:gluconokinase
LQWDEPLLALLEVEPQQLLPPVDLADTAQLRNSMAGRWPALAGIPWLPAIGDGAAANIGSDCCAARRAALTVGTSAALRVTLPSGPEALPWGLWCYRVDGRRALLGGASSEGGNLFKWLRNVLRIDAADLETALEQRAPAGHGLTVLPFIAGERSPGWADAASAVFSGMSVGTDAYDMAQAGLEAIAYRFALIAGQLETALDEVPTYIANGGALQNSPAWCRIFADVLNRPLHVHPADETTARGLALLAAEVLGRPLEACPAIDFLRVHQPDAERHMHYRVALEDQQELYRRLLG